MFEARDMTLQVERLTTSARLARRSATESQAFADETLSRFDTAQTQLDTAHTELRIARNQIVQARIQLGAAHIKLDAAHSQLDAASEQKVTLVSLPRRGLRMRFWKRKAKLSLHYQDTFSGTKRRRVDDTNRNEEGWSRQHKLKPRLVHAYEGSPR